MSCSRLIFVLLFSFLFMANSFPLEDDAGLVEVKEDIIVPTFIVRNCDDSQPNFEETEATTIAIEDFIE